MNSYEYQSPEGKVIVWPLSKVTQIYLLYSNFAP